MQRRNLLLGLGSATAAAGLLGSGAVSNFQAERNVSVNVVNDANALVGISRTSAPRSDRYLQVVDNGTAILDIDPSSSSDLAGDGLNPDATTFLDDVFQLENNSSAPLDLDVFMSGSIANGDPSADSGAVNVSLYTGSAAQGTENITRLDTNGASGNSASDTEQLDLATGGVQPIGVEVELASQADIEAADNPFQGNIQIAAVESTTTSGDTTKDGTIISMDGPSTVDRLDPQATGSSNNDITFDIDYTYDQQGGKEAKFLTVQFVDDNVVFPGSNEVEGTSEASIDSFSVRQDSASLNLNTNNDGLSKLYRTVQDDDPETQADLPGDNIPDLTEEAETDLSGLGDAASNDTVFFKLPNAIRSQDGDVSLELQEIDMSQEGGEKNGPATGNKIILGLHEGNLDGGTGGRDLIKQAFAADEARYEDTG